MLDAEAAEKAWCRLLLQRLGLMQRLQKRLGARLLLQGLGLIHRLQKRLGAGLLLRRARLVAEAAQARRDTEAAEQIRRVANNHASTPT